MPFRLQDLAERLGAGIVGEGDRPIHALRSLEAAGPDDLSFLTDLKHSKRAQASRAGALLVPRDAPELDQDLLVSDDPALDMTRLLDLFYPRPSAEPGVHPTAVVGEDCDVAASAHIGPLAVLGARCVVGERVVIHGHSYLGDEVVLACDVVVHPQVSVYPRTRIGERAVLHSGTVIGADGHGYLLRDGRYLKVPQVGNAEIGADVEIGANSAVDRATLETTRIGRGTKIDNLVQVGHNVELGENGLLCALVGIAGSSRVGDGVVMAGQSGIADHLEVGDGVTVGAQSAVLRDLAGPGVVGGTPAIPYARWRRQAVLFGRLDEMNRRLRSLEKRLAELEVEEEP